MLARADEVIENGSHVSLWSILSKNDFSDLSAQH
jgi:hypothetical protein